MKIATIQQTVSAFRQELRQQRWDDHRLYHHSRVNQSLHLLSALSFLGSYALLFVNAVFAVFIGWFVAMWMRQIGHFFFEPKDYDTVNNLSFEGKEAIKIGFNLRRKVILLMLWALAPVALLVWPDLFGTLEPHTSVLDYIHNVGVLWLLLAIGAVLGRTAQLMLTRDARTGLVWMTKILTDPLHDIKMYHKAPLHLLRGERLDPMHHVR